LSFPGDGGIFIEHYRDFYSLLINDRRGRLLLQCHDKYDDHYPGLFIFCYMDRAASCLFAANKKEKKQETENRKTSCGQTTKMGLVFYFKTLYQPGDSGYTGGID